MISRRATKILSELINELFKGSYRERVYNGITSSYEFRYKFNRETFHDFLYDRDYPEWFLILINTLPPHNERSVLEFFMGLNTGNFVWKINTNINKEQTTQLIASAKNLLIDLAKDIVNFVLDNKGTTQAKNLCQKLLEQLELDGYIFQNQQLYRAESNIINIEEETGIIHKLVKDLDLDNQDIVFHHLNLIEKDYLDGKYDDSIGNSRKFLESVLREIAKKHSIELKRAALSDDIIEWAGMVRKYLEEEKVFSESEILMYKASYGLLSETGNHPYIAQNNQAALMRNLSMTLAHYALLRFKGLSQKTP
ncbi:MAG: hypothetical protein ACYDHA_06175 [Bellilinea sp.]